MPWRHLKRGTNYEILAHDVRLGVFSTEGSVHQVQLGQLVVEATFQCSRCVEQKSTYAGPVIVYAGEDGKVWMRPRFEFYDGRFEEYGNNWNHGSTVDDGIDLSYSAEQSS